jgi:hypothetical protein
MTLSQAYSGVEAAIADDQLKKRLEASDINLPLSLGT